MLANVFTFLIFILVEMSLCPVTDNINHLCHTLKNKWCFRLIKIYIECIYVYLWDNSSKKARERQEGTKKSETKVAVGSKEKMFVLAELIRT